MRKLRTPTRSQYGQSDKGISRRTQQKLDALARQRPDLLEEVTQRRMSTQAAAIAAGIVKPWCGRLGAPRRAGLAPRSARSNARRSSGTRACHQLGSIPSASRATVRDGLAVTSQPLAASIMSRRARRAEPVRRRFPVVIPSRSRRRRIVLGRFPRRSRPTTPCRAGSILPMADRCCRSAWFRVSKIEL